MITRRKTFPSYVLVEMDLDNETQALVASVPGVTRFVGHGAGPDRAPGGRGEADPGPDGHDQAPGAPGGALQGRAST